MGEVSRDKQVKEKKDKEKKRPIDRSKKPVNHLDFEALELAIVDGQLVTRDRLLVLNRAWRTTIDDKITLCTVLYVNGNSVMLYDETLEQQFSFDIYKDVAIYPLLRIYDKTKIKKVTKQEGLNMQILNMFRPETRLNINELIETMSTENKSMIDVRASLLDLIERGFLVMDENSCISLSETVVQ